MTALSQSANPGQSTTNNLRSSVPSGDNTVVIYFENYPDNWFYDDIEKHFSKFNINGKVTLARRRNRVQRRFGFLRIKEDRNLELTLRKLNQIFIGSFRVRAFRAKFPKPYSSNSMQLEQRPTVAAPARYLNKRIESPSAIHLAASPSTANRDSRTYAQVVTNETLIFEASKNLPDHTLNSLIVTVSSMDMLMIIKDKMLDLEIVFESISFLGGLFVLIRFHSDFYMARFRSEFTKYDSLFSTVIPWEDYSPSKERFVWVSMSGVPISAWSEELFIFVGNSLGKSIAVHPSVISKDRMDSGSVLISAGFNRIECIIPIMIKGVSYLIHAHETEFPVITSSSTAEFSESDSDSKSVSSSPAFFNDDLSGKRSRATLVPSTVSETPYIAMDLTNITQRKNRDRSGDTDSPCTSERFKCPSKDDLEVARTVEVGMKMGVFEQQHEAQFKDLITKEIARDALNHS
ncbi:uncharacterized protein LOC126655524 [Mercurialis annua]|uniref:uncharacterized protein LOC126655524 n=1 Tax=Mercurialis annua TaxID=3986 RepID=UPI00215E0CC5|nr:uncharacterized protein LOC126655524 [Mercurialis annua]